MTQEAKILIGLGVVTLCILIGGIFFLSGTQPGVTPSVNEEDAKKLLVKENSHKSTEKATNVTIVEFADFQCPACAASYPVIERIKDTYKDQITFVYRYFPLQQHTLADDTAHAAEAAGMQGKFWEMYGLLFTRQNQWSEKTDASELFLSYAEELGLDIERFKKDSSSAEVRDRVNEDLLDGTTLGVNSTPTFFINGERYTGVPQEAELKEKIDVLLKK